MKKTTLLLLLVSLCCGLHAGTARVKVDFDGRSQQIGFRDFKATNGLRSLLAPWNKKDGKQQNNYLINEGKAIGDQWENFEITFTPEKTGSISMNLRERSTATGVCIPIRHTGISAPQVH
ncbi:MAG: hypothetical protein V8T87_15715 [Victivallales bacterium]